ncbi:MAG TPA: DUF305 domain-containing protein [Chloroflexota bacterium]|nr:DUF305 domain-containing protein [Chloroflexota bacterium]
MLNRLFLLVSPLVLIGTLLAARLGGQPALAQMGPMAQQSLEQLTGDEFDKAFLTEMTMHHAMAVMMARPVVANATHPELQQLGTSIINDQTREIGQMRGWARDWYGVNIPDPLAMMDAMMPMPQPGAMPGGMDHSVHGMPGGAGMPGGMMPPGQDMAQGMMGEMTMMADLWRLPPARLEAVFLTMMIPHHQGAIDMAMLVPDRAAHQELKDLAQGIMQSQSGEIAIMTAWLSSWYGL